MRVTGQLTDGSRGSRVTTWCNHGQLCGEQKERSLLPALFSVFVILMPDTKYKTADLLTYLLTLHANILTHQLEATCTVLTSISTLATLPVWSLWWLLSWWFNSLSAHYPSPQPSWWSWYCVQRRLSCVCDCVSAQKTEKCWSAVAVTWQKYVLWWTVEVIIFW